jgi:hypothetical protein
MSLNPTPEKALAVKSDGYLSASRAAFCPNGFPQGDEVTSAVPPTADICSHRGKCSDGPIPEVSSPLFHDVVGEREEFIWNGEAERLGAIAARPYEEA